MATGKAKKVIVPQADEALMPVSIDDVQDKIMFCTVNRLFWIEMSRNYTVCKRKRLIKQSRII